MPQRFGAADHGGAERPLMADPEAFLMADPGAGLTLVGAIVERQIATHVLVEDDPHLLIHRPGEE
jgi:hypothetical protein